KATPTISTTPSAGGTVGVVSLNDTATVSGGDNPTGNVTFYLFAPGGNPTYNTSGNTTDRQTLTKLVTRPPLPTTTTPPPPTHPRPWTSPALYNSHTRRTPTSTLLPYTTLFRSKATPTISTTPSAGGTVGVVSLNDTATVSGGDNPTGNVTFYLFAPGGSPTYDTSGNITGGYKNRRTHTLTPGTANSPSRPTAYQNRTSTWVPVYHRDRKNNTTPRD